MTIQQEILDIKKKKNAIILAHNYQPEEIQKIADYTGDSLELSQIAAKNDADIIVFCGVHFMAESANILSPQKKVILPEITAGCPMADMANAKQLQELKDKYPNAKVVTYINSTAEVKALSDVCCTSSNAKKIVQKVDSEQIIFAPDKNLGNYVQNFTDKEIILWDGFCPIHNNISSDNINKTKEKNPDAILIAHPECTKEILNIADKILSTGEMVSFVKKTSANKIIVATEEGMIYKLKSIAPNKEYILASDKFYCEDMKKITLEKLLKSLQDENPVIKVNKSVADKARNCLTKMLEMSK